MIEPNYNFQSEAAFAEIFSAFLKKKGYPEGSLIYQPSVKGTDGRSYKPDFLIVDPIRNERIAIIEVKNMAPNSLHMLKAQGERFKKILGDLTLPIFIVIPNSNVSKYPFDIYVVNSDGEIEKVGFELFPDFLALSSNQVAGEKQDLKKEKERTTNTFQVFSYVTAFFFVVLIIVDFIYSLNGMTLLTAERLTLLGGAAALVIIPFAQKFKELGIEWERIQDNSKSD